MDDRTLLAEPLNATTPSFLQLVAPPQPAAEALGPLRLGQGCYVTG